jgi:ABC-type histidine transport system ATPase subunit
MDAIPAIRVVDLRKNFGALEVLKGVSFDVHRGSVVSMIGASGSGKSTLLRCINFLETPSGGEIFIDGKPVGFRSDARST